MPQRQEAKLFSSSPQRSGEEKEEKRREKVFFFSAVCPLTLSVSSPWSAVRAACRRDKAEDEKARKNKLRKRKKEKAVGEAKKDTSHVKKFRRIRPRVYGSPYTALSRCVRTPCRDIRLQTRDRRLVQEHSNKSKSARRGKERGAEDPAPSP